MQVTRLKIIWKRGTVLEKALIELCMVRSEAWEVMADPLQKAFGSPMASQCPETG